MASQKKLVYLITPDRENTLIPRTAKEYNENVESSVRFVQGANSFAVVTIFSFSNFFAIIEKNMLMVFRSESHMKQ